MKWESEELKRYRNVLVLFGQGETVDMATGLLICRRESHSSFACELPCSEDCVKTEVTRARHFEELRI